MEKVDNTRAPSAGMTGDAQARPRNNYYVCLGYQDEPIPWNPLDEAQRINYHTSYFGRVFAAMEQSLEAEGLTFYLTWKIETLPSYGPDVVAVVLGDEWSRIPRYFNTVAAVFKCFGTRLPFDGHLLVGPWYLNLLKLVRFLRTQVHRMPGVLHYAAEKTKAYLRPGTAADGTIFDIPIGYANQEDLPLKDFASRRYDLYFSGSVNNKVYPLWAPQRWLQTPKSYSRQQMVIHTEQLKSKRPDLTIELDVTPFYTPRLSQSQDEHEPAAPARNYSEEMMDTKICLVPTGTTPETARLYEAMRYGCVVIAEALPSRWYLDGAPVIQLKNWNELEHTVEELLGDERLLHKQHRETLAWWRKRCSEAAVGSFMADKLNAVLARV